jgi:hypothetical protein
MSRPSSRRVAKKLSQSGRSISHETINRWRRQGWRSSQQETRHPLEIARDHLDDAVPVLTPGDPMTTSTSFVQGNADAETLDQLPDDEILRQTAREIARAACLIARAMMMRGMVAVTKPAEFGALVKALAECLEAATAVLTECTQPTANPRK